MGWPHGPASGVSAQAVGGAAASPPAAAQPGHLKLPAPDPRKESAGAGAVVRVRAPRRAPLPAARADPGTPAARQPAARTGTGDHQHSGQPLRQRIPGQQQADLPAASASRPAASRRPNRSWTADRCSSASAARMAPTRGGPGHRPAPGPPQLQRLIVRGDGRVVVRRFPRRGHQRPEPLHVHPSGPGAAGSRPRTAQRGSPAPRPGSCGAGDQDLQAGPGRRGGRSPQSTSIRSPPARPARPTAPGMPSAAAIADRAATASPGLAHLNRAEHAKPQLAFQLASPATAAHRATEARW